MTRLGICLLGEFQCWLSYRGSSHSEGDQHYRKAWDRRAFSLPRALRVQVRLEVGHRDPEVHRVLRDLRDPRDLLEVTLQGSRDHPDRPEGSWSLGDRPEGS